MDAFPSPDTAPSARRLYELSERVLELEMRLRERVESERVLDAEVRSLQRDADLQRTYLVDLEGRYQALLQQHDMTSRAAVELRAERERLVEELATSLALAEAESHHRRALQARAAVRLADSVTRTAAGHPLAVRTGTWVARKVARRIS